MIRTDARLRRALFAVSIALGVVLLSTGFGGEPILAGEMLAVGVAAGVAVYASGGGDCGSCNCC